ncbi:MAG: PIG-L deacetylase family protein [Candidatus Kerfeldbacteria bacterium]
MKYKTLHRPASFFGKKLFVIVAHPDDESYTVAGTVDRNRRAGGSCVLFCGTAGEKGASHLDKPISERSLAAIRRKELRTACKLLGVNKLHQCSFPDGMLRRHEARVLKKAERVARIHTPDIILGFGPDGISGHCDHITVHRIAKRIAKRMRIPFYQCSLPPNALRTAHRWLTKRRHSRAYRPNIKRTVPAFRIRIDPKIKLRALRCHPSQLDKGNPFSGFPKKVIDSLLKYEYFSLAQ